MIGCDVVCVLTCDGSPTDIVITYALLFITVLPCLVVIAEHVCCRKPPFFSPLDPPPDDHDKPVEPTYGPLKPYSMCTLSLWWLAMFCVFFCLQLGLCMVVGCSGMGLLSNAFFGHTVNDQYMAGTFSRTKNTQKIFSRRSPCLLLTFTAVCMVVIDLYYAFSLDLITTAGHCCAIVFGIFMSSAFWQCYNWCRRKRPQKVESPSNVSDV
ncbi:hypothetical protein DIPPA_16774 [Diplonema papillatum]|nr:hypothetical protein DIPPA_16774 [Diplonema papillatum]|eukprot:gene10958-16851_t